MNFDIFRAYDIRGIYPTDLDEEAYYRIARAYVYLFKPRTMVVGMDARLSGPALKQSLSQGFLDAGVDVIDIGEITTDMLYFTVGNYDYSGGIVVSASHNPKDYNGMKLVREKSPQSRQTADCSTYATLSKPAGPRSILPNQRNQARTKHPRRLPETRHDVCRQGRD
jgi:phosphomannomutase